MGTLRNLSVARAGVSAFALGLMIVGANGALAQDAPPQPPAAQPQSSDDKPLNSDDIVVSARRRDERLIDAPVAITAIGGETMNKYSVTRVTDLATLVPSLVAGKAASGSSASIFLRGVGSTALSAGFDQSVSFVIDNLPMSRGREISLPQFDIQRVEVLKGPQALFFGKNTTGGLISIASNNPTDRFEFGGKVGYGFKAEEKYGEAYISGPLSSTFKARLAARYANSEGAFTNTARASSTDPLGRPYGPNAARRGASESLGTRATLEWEPSSAFKLQLKAGATWLNDGGPTDLLERICGGGRTTPATMNGVPASPNTGCTIDGRADSVSIPASVASANYRYARDGKMYARFRSQYAVLTGNITSDPFDVTSISSFYHFKQTDLNNVGGEQYPATFSQLADFKQYAEELRFQTKFDGPFNIMTGLFYSHGDFVFNTDAYIFPVPVDPVTGTAVTFKRDDGFSSDSMSAFAEGTLKFGNFELSGGARFSLEARDSYQRSLPAQSAFAAAFPGNISFKDRFRDTNLSPQVTLRYKPSANTSIYAAYKQGFKSGGFNLSQSLTPAASIAAGRYNSELAKGGEVGLRTIVLNNALSFNATVYTYDYTNLQVQKFDPVTIGLIAGNAGMLRTRGVEADFNYAVPALSGFSIRGALAYNDAKYHNYIGQCYGGQTIAQGCNLQLSGAAYTAQNYEGRTPPKAPKFAGRIGATFTSALSSSLNLTLSGDVSHTSSYNYTDNLRPDSIQRAFTKVDASISVSGAQDRWKLSLIGRNLTNKYVVTSANDIPFTGGSGTGTTTGVLADMSAFIDNPREVFLELGFKF